MKSLLTLLVASLYGAVVLAESVKIIHFDWPFHSNSQSFYHAVTSENPLSNKVIICNKVTPETDSTLQVSCQVANNTAVQHVIKSGTTTTDYTVKIDVDGLNAGTTYYSYFTALGRNFLFGCKETIPAGDNTEGHLRFVVASCNDYERGFFTAYSKIVERNDTVIHLRDNQERITFFHA